MWNPGAGITLLTIWLFFLPNWEFKWHIEVPWICNCLRWSKFLFKCSSSSRFFADLRSWFASRQSDGTLRADEHAQMFLKAGSECILKCCLIESLCFSASFWRDEIPRPPLDSGKKAISATHELSGIWNQSLMVFIISVSSFSAAK